MKFNMRVQINEGLTNIAGVEFDFSTLGTRDLQKMLDIVQRELSVRSLEKKSTNLDSRLKKINLSAIDSYADNMASFYTPDSLVKKFAGGFWVDGQKLYAKTTSGVLYKYDQRDRAWKKVS